MKAFEFNSLLIQKNLTVATAESITAGLLSSTIASVSGASSILKGGIVTYSPELKIKLLQVNPVTLEKYSAESTETTVEMVQGLSQLGLGADIYVAVTGVASASVNQYTVTKSVGQIYVAILFKEKLYCFETVIKPENQENSRNEIRERCVFFIFEKITEIV